MALFSINRFMGDDEDEEEIDPNRSQNLLAKLQAEADARKAKAHQDSKDIDNANDSSTPRSKKKHRKGSEVPLSEQKKSKKKLKRNKSRESDVELDSESIGATSAKKKKQVTEEDSKSDDGDVKKQVTEEDSKSDDGDVVMELDESTFTEIKDAEDSLVHDTSVNSVDSVHDDDAVVTKDGVKEVGGFSVLGEYKRIDKKKVNRVLPEWLSCPSTISADLRKTQMPINEMTCLDEDLLEKLRTNNITHFFPVQMQVIPEILSTVKHGYLVGSGGYRPSDICVSAPTGSGKTLAFVLPIIQALKKRVTRKIRAIVVLPVKDLAVQVFKVFHNYAQGTDLQVGLAVGQSTLLKEHQALVVKKTRGYVSLVDIVVATPGRLVDHIKMDELGLDLSHLRYLVIDEADRMMDHIKQDWLATVEGALYKLDGRHLGQCQRSNLKALTVDKCSRMHIPLQKLLLSATLSQNPEKLQHLSLFQPNLYTSVLPTVPQKGDNKNPLDQNNPTGENDDVPLTGDFIGKYTTPIGLTEYAISALPSRKPLILLYFLHHLKFRRVLCFVKSRESAHRLSLLLNEFGDINVSEFSANLSSKKRTRIIKQFSSGKIDILICSDAMARGMDVKNTKCVFSYDATTYIETYVHRVGRTARAGKVGTAITLVESKEAYHFKKMLKEAGKTDIKNLTLNPTKLMPLVEQFELALQKIPHLLEGEKLKKKQEG